MQDDLGTYRHLFSIPGSQLGSHAIVSHIGNSLAGDWSCTKDRTEDCRHIQESRKLLHLLLTRDMEDLEEGFEGCPVSARICEHQLCVHLTLCLLCKLLVSKTYDNDQDRSISHLPILPPTWASLPSDPNLYDRAPPGKEVPELIGLDVNSQCVCTMGYDTFYCPYCDYRITKLFKMCISSPIHRSRW
jgi:hypothetical protein